MNNSKQNPIDQATETTEVQEHRNRHHDNSPWIKNYLDLADQAITGDSGENSG